MGCRDKGTLVEHPAASPPLSPTSHPSPAINNSTTPSQFLPPGLEQAEFAYKLKPKLPAQFKSAEQGGVPFAVILAEEEQAQGKVKIKEMGLQGGHPEKNGVMVDLKHLVQEVQARLRRKEEEDEEEEEESAGVGVGVGEVTDGTNGLSVGESDGAQVQKTGDDGV